MKLDWINVLLIILGLFIAYQLLRAIIGGSWQTEGLIIALLVFNFGLIWKMSINLVKLDMKFNRHIGWHKEKDK